MDVQDARAERRYEAREDGELVGWVEYRDQGNRRLLLHAEVTPEVGGRGVGSEMVDQVLDDVEQIGLAAIPVCSFVVARSRARASADADPAGDGLQAG